MNYISERLNHRITYIFRKETIPSRIAHKSYTLRKALSHTSTERKSTRDKCAISNTELCLRRNEVYQLTSSRCNQQYIGSATRFIHDHVREHINNENSSVKKKTHLYLPERRLQRHWGQDSYERKRPRYSTPLWSNFTLESISPHSIPEKIVLNLQTLYFNILF